MPTILNIETSGKICSVAIGVDGEVTYQLEDTEGMNHASRLAPFVDRCMQQLARRELSLDAVAVSIGPGSYTGLRIGLSLAKGLCFGLGIPLIAVSTLQILAVKAMFAPLSLDGSELLMPMIDARRMEVYTAVYDFALNALVEPRPLILTEDFPALLPEGQRVVLMGDGAEKAMPLVGDRDIMMAGAYELHARDMLALSERSFRLGEFADTAYATPCYLKDFQASVPRKML